MGGGDVPGEGVVDGVAFPPVVGAWGDDFAVLDGASGGRFGIGEASIFDEFGVESAFASVVDFFEEDAVHLGVDSGAEGFGIDVDGGGDLVVSEGED